MNMNKAMTFVSNCVRYEVFVVWIKNTRSFSFSTDDKCLLTCPQSNVWKMHSICYIDFGGLVRRNFHGTNNQWTMLGLSAALLLCRSHYDKLAVPHETHRDDGDTTCLRNSSDAADIPRTFYWIYFLYLLPQFSSYFFYNPLIFLGSTQLLTNRKRGHFPQE